MKKCRILINHEFKEVINVEKNKYDFNVMSR